MHVLVQQHLERYVSDPAARRAGTPTTTTTAVFLAARRRETDRKRHANTDVQSVTHTRQASQYVQDLGIWDS